MTAAKRTLSSHTLLPLSNISAFFLSFSSCILTFFLCQDSQFLICFLSLHVLFCSFCYCKALLILVFKSLPFPILFPHPQTIKIFCPLILFSSLSLFSFPHCVSAFLPVFGQKHEYTHIHHIPSCDGCTSHFKTIGINTL